jgi:hypothetical protein
VNTSPVNGIKKTWVSLVNSSEGSGASGSCCRFSKGICLVDARDECCFPPWAGKVWVKRIGLDAPWGLGSEVKNAEIE